MRSKCARHPETENRAHRRKDASRVRNRIVQSESQYTVAAMPVARALSALWPRLEKAFNEIGRLRTNLNLLDASVQSSLPGLRVRASIVARLALPGSPRVLRREPRPRRRRARGGL